MFKWFSSYGYTVICYDVDLEYPPCKVLCIQRWGFCRVIALWGWGNTLVSGWVHSGMCYSEGESGWTLVTRSLIWESLFLSLAAPLPDAIRLAPFLHRVLPTLPFLLGSQSTHQKMWAKQTSPVCCGCQIFCPSDIKVINIPVLHFWNLICFKTFKVQIMLWSIFLFIKFCAEMFTL